MRRREALAAAGAGLSGLSGCVGRAMEATGLAEETIPRRRLSIADADTVPAEHSLALDVEAVTPTVTPAHTAELRFELSNVGDETKTVFTGGRDVFGKMENEARTPRLALLEPSPGFAVSTEQKDGDPCWMARDIIRWDVMHANELEPGESAQITVSVFDVESANECPAGDLPVRPGLLVRRGEDKRPTGVRVGVHAPG